MPKFVEDAQLSNTRLTRDGYLVASVLCARTGIQDYLGVEVGRPELPVVHVYRPESAVFAKDSLSTFVGKPTTNDHPPAQVTADNWKEYAVGSIGEEVLREGEYIRTEDEQLEAIEEKMRQTKEKKHIQLEIKKAALAEECERKRIAAEQEAVKRAESRKRLPPDAWSSAEEAFVKTNIDMPTKELTAKLAERFGKIVTEKAVTRRKAKLREQHGIPARPKRPWTQEEDDYIAANYNRFTAEQIGNEIERTRPSVEARVILLKRSGQLDRGKAYDKSADYWIPEERAEKMDTTQIIKADDMPDDAIESLVTATFGQPEDSDKAKKHMMICKQLNQTYQEKNADYGDSFSETYQKLGIISAVTRISDKTNRLISLVGKSEAERMVKDETLRDTLIDLAGYAVLTLLEMEEAK